MVDKSDQLIAERPIKGWVEASDVADKASSSRRGINQAAAAAALEKDRSQLKELVRRSKSGNTSEKSRLSADLDRFSLQKLQNMGVKKGPAIPASGDGSPGPRQTLPLPEAGHEVTRRESAETRILLGELPSVLVPRGYTKRNTPPSREEIQAADRVLHRYRKAKEQGYFFKDEEMVPVRAAERIKYSAKKHRKLTKS